MEKYSVKTFESYLTHEKRFSKHSIDAYLFDVREALEYLGSNFNLHHPSQISLPQLRSWLVFLVKKQLKNSSTNRKLSSLKAFFRFLHREGVIPHNKAASLNSLKIPQRLPSFISTGPLQHLLRDLSEADMFPEIRDHLMLYLLYATGMRRSELIGLGDGDILSSQGVLRVIGKGKKERRIPLSGNGFELVRQYIKVRNEHFGSLVFPSLLVTNKGKMLYPKLVYNIVRKYISQITTSEKKGPHTLRHSFATHLLEGGAEISAIKKLLGHTSLASTQVYTGTNVEQLKNAYLKAHPKGK